MHVPHNSMVQMVYRNPCIDLLVSRGWVAVQVWCHESMDYSETEASA